jgi:hypothetical protein
MATTYSFEIEVKFGYVPEHWIYELRKIVVRNTTIIAKNEKHGGLYRSKYIQSIAGTFVYVCGTVQYPILSPRKKSVLIKVAGFPKKPQAEDNEAYCIKNIVQENNQ